MLTTAALPESPVLVITQCEHRGNHDVAVIQAGCGEPDCGGGGGRGGGGGGCTPPSHNWGDKEIQQDIKINNSHEPWIKGKPEIYASYAFSTSESNIRGKYSM